MGRSVPGAEVLDAGTTAVLQCVANVSEGRDAELISRLADACEPALLDVHSDPDHNRSVFTLAGPAALVEGAARQLARAALEALDLRRHQGEHPRFGVLDVVPWVALEGWPLQDADPTGPVARAARAARWSFANWVASELEVPVFLYGPERSLPEVRRRAWKDLLPDRGPLSPHPRAGSVACGLRPLLVAYNLCMGPCVGATEARAIAGRLRSPEVRALAFKVRGCYQVSCNLVRPFSRGPAQVFDLVEGMAPVQRAELVGLLPALVLKAVPKERWAELDLGPERTIEARLAAKSSAAGAMSAGAAPPVR